MNKLALALAGSAIAFSTAANATDGAKDPTFGNNGVGYVHNHAVAGGTSPIMQPDGKVIICDARADEGMSSGQDMLVARFNADGTLDTSFSFDGRVFIDFTSPMGFDACHALALQPDGKLVVVGDAYPQGAGGSDFGIARLNADGTLDTSFGSGTGKVTVGFQLGAGDGESAQNVAIQPDGRIVVSGYASTQAHSTDFAVARLLPDGTVDSSFNLTGRVTIDFARAAPNEAADVGRGLALDAQGRILVSGSAGTGGQGDEFAIARLLPNGALDNDFDSDGLANIALSSSPNGIAAVTGVLQQRDGRIVLFGAVDTSTNATVDYDMALARLLPDGSLDESFGFAGKTIVAFNQIPKGADVISAMVEQDNGKLVAVGYAGTAVNATKALAAALRLNVDGSLDSGFGNGGKKTYDLQLTSPSLQLFTGAALQGTQLIVSGGVITSDGSADDFVMRLEIDSIFANGF